jgi:Cyclic nucleotide-binding domain
MRYESSITSVSWIPSEAVAGGTRIPFDAGITHYDGPPPDRLGGLDDLRALSAADRFRFANRLSARIDVDHDGTISAPTYTGSGLITNTILRVGPVRHVFQAVALPDLRHEPVYGDGWVRFTQTAGGRTGMPAPRHVRRAPFIQWQAPLAWTTLALTLYADGRAEGALVGASRFPRHWVYGADGELVEKSGLIDFSEWYRRSFGLSTPWGRTDSDAFVTAVESALERELSASVMHGAAQPRILKVPAGTTIVDQGEEGSDVYLVLDGVVRVEVDGTRLAEYGPGALLGERAFLEGGTRTSTLVAVTSCKVASVPAASLERDALEQLSADHRREDPGAG